MTILGRNWIGVVDYIVIVASFLALILIGWISSVKKKGPVTEEGYVLGNRDMSVVPVAFSIAATFTSAFSLTAVTVEMYRYGISMFYAAVFMLFWKVIAAYVFVPVFHQATYTSVYHYLELRYDKTIRRIISLHYCLCSLAVLGVILYAPAISISSISGTPYWVTVLVGGIICTSYCTMGGFKAVVWTDMLQCVIVIGSMVIVVIFGVNSAGGIAATWRKGVTETEAALIPFFDAHHRYSFLNVLCHSFVFAMNASICNQAGGQRFLSVKNNKMALQTFILGAFISSLIHTLLLSLSIVLLALYHHCDPKRISEETGVVSDDQIFIFAVTQLMGAYPGLMGLAIVALISASLSTISSYINSVATLAMEDFLKPMLPEYFNSERRRIIGCKLLTLVFGLITIMTSLAVPFLGSAMRALMSFLSLDGARVAIILLGMLSRRVNTKSCKIAYAVTAVFMIWIIIGSLRVKAKSKTLKHTTDECMEANSTGNFNDSFFTKIEVDVMTTRYSTEVNLSTRSNLKIPQQSENESRNNLTGESNNNDTFILYRISVFWLLFISFSMTMVLHFGLSQFIGKEEIPDDKLLSPLIVHLTRRFKKERMDGNAEVCETIELKSNVEC